MNQFYQELKNKLTIAEEDAIFIPADRSFAFPSNDGVTVEPE